MECMSQQLFASLFGFPPVPSDEDPVGEVDTIEHKNMVHLIRSDESARLPSRLQSASGQVIRESRLVCKFM